MLKFVKQPIYHRFKTDLNDKKSIQKTHWSLNFKISNPFVFNIKS